MSSQWYISSLPNKHASNLSHRDCFSLSRLFLKVEHRWVLPKYMDFQINTEWLSFAIFGSSFNSVSFSFFSHFPSFLESEWEGPIISQPEISTKWVASKEMGCKRNLAKENQFAFYSSCHPDCSKLSYGEPVSQLSDAPQVPYWLWMHFETVDFLCTTSLWLRNWLSFLWLLVGRTVLPPETGPPTQMSDESAERI